MITAIASILLLGCSVSEAFTPPSSVSIKSTTTTQLSLGYISGPEDGLKHKPFGSPGHFEIIGGKSDAGRSMDAHIDTRKRIEGQEIGIWQQSCGYGQTYDAISGNERRAMWQSYAPTHGTPTQSGAIGCPGGGDWCYASSYGAAAPISDIATNKKRSANVAAALAGLGNGVGGARTDGYGVSITKVGGVVGAGMPALPAVSSSSSGGLIGATTGHDIHHARASYTPFDDAGRVITVGEVGAPANKIGSSGSSISFVGGGGTPVRVARKKGGYGLGSWSN